MTQGLLRKRLLGYLTTSPTEGQAHKIGLKSPALRQGQFVMHAVNMMRVTCPMNTITPGIQELARRLIAIESRQNPSAGPVGAALKACEALRGLLAKFVGVVGYSSLLSRALAMARSLSPSLASVRVRPDGSLEGFVETEQGQDEDAGAIVLAQLLGLLATFIGEPMMLRIVHDAWPDATRAEAETDRIGEGRS